MKFEWYLLLLLALSSCCDENPLKEKEGVWVTTNGYSRDFTAVSVFYMIIDKGQIENEEISLSGHRLIVKHAERYMPFLTGTQEFYVSEINDSIIKLVPSSKLPYLFANHPDRHYELILQKCKTHPTIKPQSFGMLAFHWDSIHPANFLIDIKGNTAYLQQITHRKHSDSDITMLKKCMKLELTKEEQKTLKKLLEYTHFDTIPELYGMRCRFGYLTDDGFKFNGRNFPMKFYGKDGNTNYALEGFMFTLKKRGKWEPYGKQYSFSAYLPE